MPHNLDRHISVAILDSRHVAEEIVLLRLIVVQPADDFVRRRGIDVDDRLAPNHFDALDSRGKFVLKRLRRSIRLAAPMRNVPLRCWRSAGCARSGSYDLESTHSPDLVWFTEFPNGSPNSSMTDGGM